MGRDGCCIPSSKNKKISIFLTFENGVGTGHIVSNHLVLKFRLLEEETNFFYKIMR